MATGASPRWSASRHGESARACHQRTAPYMTIDDGTYIASVPTSAPANPATCQPISAAISVEGPGAARDSANTSANCCGVIQPRSTTWTCMSAMIAWPPPNETSDSGANTRMSPSSRLSMAALRLHVELKADAQRREHDNDRDHRPVEHADGDEDHRRDHARHDPPNVPRQLHAELEHHADADRDDPSECRLHDRRP